MKVCGVPKEVSFPEPDYSNFDFKKEQEREKLHKQDLKNWLQAQGYEGEHTGEVLSFPVADGHAQYMMADGGKKSLLIHLPYGDSYHYRDVEFLPRSEIVKRIGQEKGLQSIFGPR